MLAKERGRHHFELWDGSLRETGIGRETPLK